MLFLSMILNNPAALWFLLLLIVPILIHLFNFRRFTKVYFSNNSFFEQLLKSNNKQNQIRKWIVLFNRLLFLLFIVIFLLDLSFEEETDGLSSKLAHCFIDNSPVSSLAVKGESISSLDFMNELSSNSSSINSKVYTQKGGYLIRTGDGEFNDSNWPFSCFDYSILLNDDKFGGDKILFSNFTDYKLRTLAPQSVDSSSITVIQPALDISSNLFVDSVFVDNQRAERDYFYFSIRNEKGIFKGDVGVKLFKNDRQIATKRVKLNGEKNLVESFTIEESYSAIDQFTISLVDYNTGFNNDFYFVNKESDKKSVAYLHGDQKNLYIDKLFLNDVLFNYTSYFYGAAPYNIADNVDVVVIDYDVLNITESELELLLKSDLTIILLANKTGSRTSSGLFKNAVEFGDDILCRMELDFDNPFFEGIIDQGNTATDQPRVAPVYNMSSGSNTLIQCNMGLSILEKPDYGREVYLLNADMNSANSNLTQHALFLPVFYKIILNNTINRSLNYFYVNDDVIDVSIENASATDVYEFINEDLAFIPNQRFLNKNILRIEVDNGLIRPGFFKIVRQGTDSVVAVTAWNLPNAEKYVFPADENTITQTRRYLPNLRVINSEDGIPTYIAGDESLKGMGLLEYLLIFALLFLFIEILAIRFLK